RSLNHASWLRPGCLACAPAGKLVTLYRRVYVRGSSGDNGPTGGGRFSGGCPEPSFAVRGSPVRSRASAPAARRGPPAAGSSASATPPPAPGPPPPPAGPPRGGGGPPPPPAPPPPPPDAAPAATPPRPAAAPPARPGRSGRAARPSPAPRLHLGDSTVHFCDV